MNIIVLKKDSKNKNYLRREIFVKGKTTEVGDIDLKDIPLYKKGKVRNVYDLKDKLLIVASDRISAFDYILPSLIPFKGAVLNQISLFWFDYLKDIVDNHLLESRVDKYPVDLQKYEDILSQRSILVKKSKLIPLECVVRGYLAGSGWKEYKEMQSICGVKLPKGLAESDKLPEPIFTPSTKAEEGHDENITHQQVIDLVSKGTFDFLKEKSIALYLKAEKYAKDKGIIIADTKFEFGFDGKKIILIDEALTPDSSRFWDIKEYSVGISPPSYDKQFVRDYLETLNWDKTPPAPELPEEIVNRTSEKYLQSLRMITGKEL